MGKAHLGKLQGPEKEPPRPEVKSRALFIKRAPQNHNSVKSWIDSECSSSSVEGPHFGRSRFREVVLGNWVLALKAEFTEPRLVHGCAFS